MQVQCYNLFNLYVQIYTCVFKNVSTINTTNASINYFLYFLTVNIFVFDNISRISVAPSLALSRLLQRFSCGIRYELVVTPIQRSFLEMNFLGKLSTKFSTRIPHHNPTENRTYPIRILCSRMTARIYIGVVYIVIT